MSSTMFLACIAIGVGAALAAMTWPFRRGPLGVVIVFAAGIGGALGLTALSYTFLPVRGSPTHLLFATAGAIGVLLLTHGVWFWTAARARHSH